MATPRSSTYSVALGATIYAGMAAPTPPVAWRTAIAPSTWGKLPLAAKLDSLNPRYDPALNPKYAQGTFPEYMSANSWSGIMAAWCGAAWDDDRCEMVLPLQGGHADYAGNDSIALSVAQATPAWRRIGNPSGYDGTVITDDRPLVQAGSSGVTVVLARDPAAPKIYGGTDAASDADGAYVGQTLYVQGQTGRTITAYVGATCTATVDSPYASNIVGRSYGIGNGAAHGAVGERSGRYADGRARSIHSYNKPIYSPFDDAWWIPVQGNCSWSGAAGAYWAIRIDRQTGAHSFYGPIDSVSAAAPSGGGACYDSKRNGIWWFGQNGSRFCFFDIATKTWVYKPYVTALSGYISLTYLPDRDCILLASDSATAPFWIYNCATNAFNQITPSGTALGGNTAYGHAQLRYVQSRGYVAWWNNTTDLTSINYMQLPSDLVNGAWSIQQLPVSASNTVTPSAQLGNGTYGRFAYSTKLDGFVLTNSTSDDVYFFALS